MGEHQSFTFRRWNYVMAPQQPYWTFYPRNHLTPIFTDRSSGKTEMEVLQSIAQRMANVRGYIYPGKFFHPWYRFTQEQEREINSLYEAKRFTKPYL